MWHELPVAIARSWAGPVLLIGLAAALVADLLLAAAAFLEATRQRRRQRLADRLSLFESDLAPPVSIVLHADRDSDLIVDRVRALLPIAYPAFEVVVAVDGADEESLGRLTQAFGLRPVRRTPRARLPKDRLRGLWATPEVPNLLVVDVADPGRARALNAALACARHPLFLTLDARTSLERDTLVALALPFYEDRSVFAVGAVVRPARLATLKRDGVPDAALPARQSARFEALEALRETLIHGLGWAFTDSLFVLPGPLALFDRAAVRAAGGYRHGVAWADTDLVMRLQRWAGRNHRRLAVRMVGSAVAWREPAPSLRAHSSRRMTEQRGLIEALWINRGLLMNTRFSFHHGIAFISQAFAGTFRPAFELAALALAITLAATGHADAPFVWMFVAVHGAGGTLVSLLALALERSACRRLRWPRDLETLAIDALVEPFLYRPLTSSARLAGAVRAVLANARVRRPAVEGGAEGRSDSRAA